MANCETRYFGTIGYDEPSVIVFPAGLPGFPQSHRFLLVEDSAHRPLVFLQSLDDSQLCFLLLPVALVDSAYRLKMSAEDMALIGFDHLPALETEAQVPGHRGRRRRRARHRQPAGSCRNQPRHGPGRPSRA